MQPLNLDCNVYEALEDSGTGMLCCRSLPVFGGFWGGCKTFQEGCQPVSDLTAKIPCYP